MRDPQLRSRTPLWLTYLHRESILRRFLPVIALLLALAIPRPASAIDLDADNLDDLWEAFFGAQSVLPGDDEDGDDKTNLEECLAGTDPFDASDCFDADNAQLSSTSGSITFPSVDGKLYQLYTGSTFSALAPIGDPIHGTGADITVTLSTGGPAKVTGTATHEVWTNLTVTGELDAPADLALLTDLTGDAGYPATPDGTEALSRLQTPSNLDDNYGGRIRGSIVPTQSGSYTFTLASNDAGRFSFDDGGGLAVRITTPADNAVGAGDFTAAQSAGHTYGPVSLTAGQAYEFEVIHAHGSRSDHCAVGWSGPGLTGTEVVSGDFLCPVATASGTMLAGGDMGFLTVAVQDQDQDGDGLTDASEKRSAGDGNLSPYDANSTALGGSDLAAITAALGASSEVVEVVAVDAEAIEDNRNGTQVDASDPVASAAPNPGRFRVTRTGTLQPLTVTVNLTAPTTPFAVDEDAAEPGDYNATDVNGTPVTTTVSLGFGQVSADILINPVDDSGSAAPHEFPETVICQVVDTAAYDPGASATAEVLICDAKDIPEQEILLVASSEPEPGSVGPQGSAVVAGKMNGRKDHMVLNTIINSGFSSPQDDSHIHKANAGNVPGSIVYEVLNTPGDPVSGPKLGPIGPDYPYPIEGAAGNDACRIVDSFFNQNGETKMYLNWHTVNNGSGELWALFNVATGSIDPPVHPPMPGHTLLSGDALESEIVRFLNQATFGATDLEVQAIKAAIETERTTGGNPNYSRIEEFENWIDAQIALDQTYLLDYLISEKFQEWVFRRYFDKDPALWWTTAEFPDDIGLPPNDPGQTWTVGPITPIGPATDVNAPLVMPRPSELGATWPSIDRSGPDPLYWVPTDDYPLSRSHRAWGDDNDNDDNPDANGNLVTDPPRPTYNSNNNTYNFSAFNKWVQGPGGRLGRPNERTRFLIHWMMHTNAHDQLRQKMGYSLQQIDVVANTLTIIQDRDLGMANYQDQINRLAFGKYRDIIDFIMHSPQMGWWLSSFNNQKAVDLNGDMIIDLFPDENLAREVMQLFTCGLFLLHPDGSLALNSGTGLPQATYSNDDITELSRIITGHGYGRHIGGNGLTEHTNWDNPIDNVGNNSFSRGAGDSRIEHTFNYPMKMFGGFHDIGPKTILGGKVIDNSALADGTGSTGNNHTDPSWDDEVIVGNLDMKQALDWLAGDLSAGTNFDQVNSHQSTAPFIAKRLIQRFVTSNPSSAYTQRVTLAFRDGYGAHGGNGDLTSAVKAILLDYEARDPAAATNTFGLKKSPYEAYVQVLRAFDAHSQTPVNPYTGSEPATYTGNGDYNIATNPDLYLQNFGYPATQRDNFRLNTQYRYNITDSQLSMSPMNQPTVFNFYLPDYSPGGVISASSLVSPEMMLANEGSLYQNVNYFYTLTTNTGGESELDFAGRDAAWKVTSGNAANNERIRIDFNDFAAANYPGSGTELERDTALFDEMDRRLTGGIFKAKYPWNPADDDDPFVDGVNPAFATTGDGNFTNDAENINPREAIITYMGETFGTGGNGPRDKFRFGLYLLTTSPDYLVRQ